MTPARAAVLAAPGKVEIHSFERGTLPEGQGGWLRVEACGVCGADVASYKGYGQVKEFGVVLGHEIVGTVDELAPDLVQRWGLRPGERVLVEEFMPCHHCALCLSGRYRRCPHRRLYGLVNSRITPSLWGGFADYLYLDPDSIFYRVPEGVSATTATFAVPLSNGFSWTHATGRMRIGDVVAVLGPGQQGLACVIAADAGGAAAVIVSGLEADTDRLATAAKLGAGVTVTGKGEAVVEAVMAASGGRGADVVIDTTPLDTDVIKTAVRCAAIGGRIVLAGLKRSNTLDGLSTDEIIRREVTISGVTAREPWAVTTALDWLSRNGHRAGVGGEVFAIEQTEQAIRALGGLDDGPAPVHVVVKPEQTA